MPRGSSHESFLLVDQVNRVSPGRRRCSGSRSRKNRYGSFSTARLLCQPRWKRRYAAVFPRNKYLILT